MRINLFVVIGIIISVIGISGLYLTINNDEKNVEPEINVTKPYDDTELYRSWQYNYEHPFPQNNNTCNGCMRSSDNDYYMNQYYFSYSYAWHPFNYWHQTGLGW